MAESSRENVLGGQKGELLTVHTAIKMRPRDSFGHVPR